MSQETFDQSVPRAANRRRVIDAADVRALQPLPARDAMKPVTIVDVSAGGASLRMPVDAEIILHDVFDLGVDDTWGLVRVVWGRVGPDHVLMCGVEFLDPHPAFLSALDGLLGAVAELRPVLAH